MRYLLDTSVCIPLINGTDEHLKSRLLEQPPASVLLCSVVKAELLFGARYSSCAAENLDRISRFCRVFESLPFDDEAAQHHGGIRAQLKREGRPIGANDMLIAATALAADLTLVTRNLEEFKRVPGLMVDDWR
jgi:tRNA(fMet)-specific endonuclease VapC